MTTAQGDPRLVEDPIAQELLHSRELARLAYSWLDGTPRVVPIWFHWTGAALTFGSPPGAPKLRALERQPRVAVTIDAADGWPYHALMVRGDATVEILDDVSDEYAAAARRYFGDEQGGAWLAQLSGHPMARISVTPSWVGVLDFETRFPSALSLELGAYSGMHSSADVSEGGRRCRVRRCDRQPTRHLPPRPTLAISPALTVKARAAQVSLVVQALAPRHLLQLERVAVGIGKLCPFDPAPEVVDLADLHTSTDKLSTRFGNVLYDQIQAPDAAWLSRVHIKSSPETYRTTRALWGQLDDPDALAGLHVDIELEAELATIEGDGSVYIRNRQRNQFELDLHRMRAPLGLFASRHVPTWPVDNRMSAAIGSNHEGPRHRFDVACWDGDHGVSRHSGPG